MFKLKKIRYGLVIAPTMTAALLGASMVYGSQAKVTQSSSGLVPGARFDNSALNYVLPESKGFKIPKWLSGKWRIAKSESYGASWSTQEDIANWTDNCGDDDNRNSFTVGLGKEFTHWTKTPEMRPEEFFIGPHIVYELPEFSSIVASPDTVTFTFRTLEVVVSARTGIIEKTRKIERMASFRNYGEDRVVVLKQEKTVDKAQHFNENSFVLQQADRVSLRSDQEPVELAGLPIEQVVN